MTFDPRVRVHQDWLGMVQPSGLFLAPRVLADADATPTEPVTDLQRELLDRAPNNALRAPLDDLAALLAWPEGAVLRSDALPTALTLTLDGGAAVAPDLAIRDLDTDAWVLLAQELPPDTDLDRAADDALWTASPQQRLERLLRAKECPLGLLTNGREVRVVYAPKGEATAHATWRVADLTLVAGRPLLAALHMCLNARRLLTLAPAERLTALLAASREFQNTVSTELQGQVLDALQELLDGLQRADRLTDGRLLAPWRDTDARRQVIYHGLVTALLRLVFVLFAEERRLLPIDSARYRGSYALGPLHAQLQEDHDRLGDRLDARFGAWARIIALFRLLHDGLDARALPAGFSLPARRGELFDPDRFAFLEGRPEGPRPDGPLELPKISDGTVYRVLDRLLVLKGERLKYGELAVEQIGSVYEGIMGYALEFAEGRALRLRVGAVDFVVDLQRFTTLPRKDFTKHLTETLGLKLTDATKAAVEKSADEDAVIVALSAQRSFKNAQPIAAGWMFLQPGEERRRSGSHYTPRALTQPIVQRTLAPVLAALGAHPTPEAILGLKVCDPAMGSGAFLVEACRQLADALEAAWKHHGRALSLPPDEDPHLHARRRVAQRCLYGVDRNPLAAELARLSLWLETSARDHAFTFLDHALRHGDSLVGVSREQIASVSLDTAKGTQVDIVHAMVTAALARVARLRAEIHTTGDDDPPDTSAQRALWREAQDELARVRTLGDLLVAGFFGQKSERDRARWIEGWHRAVELWCEDITDGAEVHAEVSRVLRERGLVPFHWEIEFPEVFSGERAGFDAFVGNPPFVGGSKISGTLGTAYLEWIKSIHEESHGNADLVAHFFRRAFNLLRDSGTFGLIATNTIAQGDTRATGLRWICTHGGTIYDARRRYRWPGVAAVIVSVVHMRKGPWPSQSMLDGRRVSEITAFLFHSGGHLEPIAVNPNTGLYSKGADIGGIGFTFDDRQKRSDDVSQLADMHKLIEKDPRNAERIFPYLGGEELNEHPEQEHHRYIISFGDMSEDEARAWPDLMAIVEAKVKPERDKNNRESYRRYWWQFAEKRSVLFRAMRSKERVIGVARVSQTLAFAFLPSRIVLNEKIVVFVEDRGGFFVIMQSRVHETWARFFSSTMKDDLQYTPSECFETFPFPTGWETSAALEDLGKRYDAHRAAIMRATIGTKRPEGLTATYNRFHDPDERAPAIATLRALHAEMDRAVLDAYGWADLRPAYDFRVQLDERVRLTWDDDTRDEVLARLLEENRRRAEAMKARAAAEAVPAKKPRAKAKGARDEGGGTPGLPGVG
jgi:hypothetical protein